MLLVSDDVISDVVGISNPVPHYSTTDKEIYEDKNGALAPFVVKTVNGSLFTIYDVSHFFLCVMFYDNVGPRMFTARRRFYEQGWM